MMARRPLTRSLFSVRRGGWLAGAALLLLVCPACSQSLRTALRPDWKHHKLAEATEPQASPQSAAPPAREPATGSPQTSTMAYPWAGGASLPTAAAQAPVIRR